MVPQWVFGAITLIDNCYLGIHSAHWYTVLYTFPFIYLLGILRNGTVECEFCYLSCSTQQFCLIDNFCVRMQSPIYCTEPVLRIRDRVFFLSLDPGPGMEKNPDPGWTSQITFRELTVETVFLVKNMVGT